MTNKEALLARMRAERQALLDAIEGLPDEALTAPGAVEAWSAMDVLAYLTAWDGETLRRIAFALGENHRSPHDVNDEAYWQAWGEKQVEIKRLMGLRGVRVDLVGTWVRLLARIEALSPEEYARWVEMGPGFFPQRRDLTYARRLHAWREKWERSQPWWRRLRHRLKKL